MQNKDSEPTQPSSSTMQETTLTTQTTAPTETTVPPTTQAPTQPDPENFNPFTGEVLLEPMLSRPFLISVNNSKKINYEV